MLCKKTVSGIVAVVMLFSSFSWGAPVKYLRAPLGASDVKKDLLPIPFVPEANSWLKEKIDEFEKSLGIIPENLKSQIVDVVRKQDRRRLESKLITVTDASAQKIKEKNSEIKARILEEIAEKIGNKSFTVKQFAQLLDIDEKLASEILHNLWLNKDGNIYEVRDEENKAVTGYYYSPVGLAVHWVPGMTPAEARKKWPRARILLVGHSEVIEYLGATTEGIRGAVDKFLAAGFKVMLASGEFPQIFIKEDKTIIDYVALGLRKFPSVFERIKHESEKNPDDRELENFYKGMEEVDKMSLADLMSNYKAFFAPLGISEGESVESIRIKIIAELSTKREIEYKNNILYRGLTREQVLDLIYDAYEPIEAIKTTAISKELAEFRKKYICKYIAKVAVGVKAEELEHIYGGGVKSENVGDFGTGLIGRASAVAKKGKNDKDSVYDLVKASIEVGKKTGKMVLLNFNMKSFPTVSPAEFLAVFIELKVIKLEPKSRAIQSAENAKYVRIIQAVNQVDAAGWEKVLQGQDVAELYVNRNEVELPVSIAVEATIQGVALHEKYGSYTGEQPAKQLGEIGVKAVIVDVNNDKNAIIKIKNLIAQGITPLISSAADRSNVAGRVWRLNQLKEELGDKDYYKIKNFDTVTSISMFEANEIIKFISEEAKKAKTKNIDYLVIKVPRNQAIELNTRLLNIDLDGVKIALLTDISEVREVAAELYEEQSPVKVPSSAEQLPDFEYTAQRKVIEQQPKVVHLTKSAKTLKNALPLAINGSRGRIGILDIADALLNGNFKVAAINGIPLEEKDLKLFADTLINPDSTYGDLLPVGVEIKIGRTNGQSWLSVDGEKILVFNERKNIVPWNKLLPEVLKNLVVFEASGKNLTTEEAKKMHLAAGAGMVMFQAPGKDDTPAIVLSVNEEKLEVDTDVFGNASCTTNAIAPVARQLQDAYGVEDGAIVTVHSFTGDQAIKDTLRADEFARAFAGGSVEGLTKTGAAKLLQKLIDGIGAHDGKAIRVPTPTGSVVLYYAKLKKPVKDKKDLVALFEKAAKDNPDRLAVGHDLSSNEIVGRNQSALVDLDSIQILGDGQYIALNVWYDNEWGYVRRSLDLAVAVAEKIEKGVRVKPAAVVTTAAEKVKEAEEVSVVPGEMTGMLPAEPVAVEERLVGKPVRLVINGVGEKAPTQIDRLIIRQLLGNPNFELAAINGIGSLEVLKAYAKMLTVSTDYNKLKLTIEALQEKGTKKLYLVISDGINTRTIPVLNDKELKVEGEIMVVELLSNKEIKEFKAGKNQNVIKTVKAKGSVLESSVGMTAGTVLEVLRQKLDVKASFVSPVASLEHEDSLLDSGGERSAVQNILPLGKEKADRVVRELKKLNFPVAVPGVKVPVTAGTYLPIVVFTGKDVPAKKGSKKDSQVDYVNDLLKAAAKKGLIDVVKETTSNNIVGEKKPLVDTKHTLVIGKNLVVVFALVDEEYNEAARVLSKALDLAKEQGNVAQKRLKTVADLPEVENALVKIDWNGENKMKQSAVPVAREVFVEKGIQYAFTPFHAGRPETGSFNEKDSVKSNVEQAQNLITEAGLDVKVVVLPYEILLKEIPEEKAKQMIAKIKQANPGKKIWFVFENIRFYEQEKSKDAMVQLWLMERIQKISGAEAYIDAAFESAQNDKDASQLLRKLFEKRVVAAKIFIDNLSSLVKFEQKAGQPKVEIFGGAKFDKLKYIADIAESGRLGEGDVMSIVGALGKAYLKYALGVEVGASLLPKKDEENEIIDYCLRIKAAQEAFGFEMIVPEDHIALLGGEVKVIDRQNLLAGEDAVDIGPKTRQKLVEAINKVAKAGKGEIIMNGGTGVFEKKEFRQGTSDTVLAAEKAAINGVSVLFCGEDMTKAGKIVEQEQGHSLSSEINWNTGGGVVLSSIANNGPYNLTLVKFLLESESAEAAKPVKKEVISKFKPDEAEVKVGTPLVTLVNQVRAIVKTLYPDKGVTEDEIKTIATVISVNQTGEIKVGASLEHLNKEEVDRIISIVKQGGWRADESMQALTELKTNIKRWNTKVTETSYDSKDYLLNPASLINILRKMVANAPTKEYEGQQNKIVFLFTEQAIKENPNCIETINLIHNLPAELKEDIKKTYGLEIVVRVQAYQDEKGDDRKLLVGFGIDEKIVETGGLEGIIKKAEVTDTSKVTIITTETETKEKKIAMPEGAKIISLEKLEGNKFRLVVFDVVNKIREYLPGIDPVLNDALLSFAREMIVKGNYVDGDVNVEQLVEDFITTNKVPVIAINKELDQLNRNIKDLMDKV